jgi:hypothetical protein
VVLASEFAALVCESVVSDRCGCWWWSWGGGFSELSTRRAAGIGIRLSDFVGSPSAAAAELDTFFWGGNGISAG